MSLRDSRWWDRQLEGGLPDCRLSGTKRARSTVYLGRLELERVFCANCGADGGGAFNVTHIFYLCDSCARTGGTPPGTVEIDEATMRGRTA